MPNFLPQSSTIFPGQLPRAAAGLVLGQPLPAEACMAMGATAAWTVLFIFVALWRFAREEF